MVEVKNDYFEGLVSKVTDPAPSIKLSYTGMDTFNTCNYRFNKTYNENKRSLETTLALELGSLCHKVLEMKCHMMTIDMVVDWHELKNILYKGIKEEHLLGVDDLQTKYYEEWYTKDKDNNLDYDQKIAIFEKLLKTEMDYDGVWTPAYYELPFNFVYKNKVIFNGYIDRVDINEDGEYRVIDYKTSKKIFDKNKVVTSLQFGIYALAIYEKFGKLPIEYLYRFIFLDKSQEAMTKGFERRLEKKLDSILNKIDENKESKIWTPSPSPLCAWCPYSGTNPNAKEYKGECQYYSLWTPTKKTFEVNKKFDADIELKNQLNSKKRKIIF